MAALKMKSPGRSGAFLNVAWNTKIEIVYGVRAGRPLLVGPCRPSCTESPLRVHFRSHTEGRRMDSILGLSGQLMGLWLAIVGMAIVFGVLYAIGSSLGHWKRHRNHEDQGGRAG